MSTSGLRGFNFNIWMSWVRDVSVFSFSSLSNVHPWHRNNALRHYIFDHIILNIIVIICLNARFSTLGMFMYWINSNKNGIFSSEVNSWQFKQHNRDNRRFYLLMTIAKILSLMDILDSSFTRFYLLLYIRLYKVHWWRWPIIDHVSDLLSSKEVVVIGLLSRKMSNYPHYSYEISIS